MTYYVLFFIQLETRRVWESPLAKGLAGLFYLQRALSNEFLLGATGTSFLTI